MLSKIATALFSLALLSSLPACGDKSSDKSSDSDKSKKDKDDKDGDDKKASGKSSAKASADASSGGAAGPAEFKEYNLGADLLKIPSKGGEMCPSPGMRLLSKTKMISCIDGKPAQEMECKGPKGLTLDGGVMPACDISKNAAGDLCHILVADSGCDGKKRVTCDLDIEKMDAPPKVVIKECKKACVMKKDGEIETAECEGEED